MVAMIQPNAQSQAVLEGKVSRVVFKAADTGYAVIQIELPSFETETAVGTMPDAEKGTPVILRGEWITHAKFGKQFKFSSYTVPEPEGEAGTIGYLSTLKGVKESLAKAIYAKFGDGIFSLLDNEPDRLIEVRGIGKKTLPKILESYQKTKGIRQLIGFLHELGVSPGYATKIYKEYREESIATIKNNPYLLADSVRGFGFKKADEVALGLGIAKDSQFRTEAGILQCLKSASNMGGHCYLPKAKLCSEAADLLSLPDYRPTIDQISTAMQELKRSTVKDSMRIVEEPANLFDEERIYSYNMHQAETGLARRIRQAAGSISINLLDVEDWIDDYEDREGIKLAPGQRTAVATVASNAMSIMTGGAGVGKSATSKAIIQYWHSRGMKIVAAAPTGKAAQRIREATGLTTACTIHRLLGWSGTGFEHDDHNPIEGDAFLIDEASMMDLRLAYALFRAIPRHATILLVGDVNQLPSVGPGNVLRDIINSGVVPVAKLTEVFRQSGTSRIIQTSHQINGGQFPDLETIGRSTNTPLTDALWVKCSQENIIPAIQWLVSEKLFEMGWNREQIQCLSPQHRGDVGNIAINQLIQNLWNPAAPSKKESHGLREGDRVIQNRNDYDKKVFNGDIGVIEKIDTSEYEALIRFPDMDNPDGRIVTYEESDLDDLSLAYSISIHRSQGSEFPVVIIPASNQHFILLQRNLYYTGVTRAKKLLIVVGEEKALAQAVRTQKISQRCTALDARLEA